MECRHGEEDRPGLPTSDDEEDSRAFPFLVTEKTSGAPSRAASEIDAYGKAPSGCVVFSSKHGKDGK